MIFSFELLIYDEKKRTADNVAISIICDVGRTGVVVKEKEDGMYAWVTIEGESFIKSAFDIIDDINTVDGLTCVMVNSLDDN
ncbi:hypothetical protein [Photobacterium kagoshimensis]|uniref:hypothetical protein n=1 Tax=Photobacterium kagoshimensis TaxID=2910242 RepID=UPI003D11EBF7